MKQKSRSLFSSWFSSIISEAELTHQSNALPKKKVWLPSEGYKDSYCEPSFILCRVKSLLRSNLRYSELPFFGHDWTKTPLPFDAKWTLASSENLWMSLEENVCALAPPSKANNRQRRRLIAITMLNPNEPQQKEKMKKLSFSARRISYTNQSSNGYAQKKKGASFKQNGFWFWNKVLGWCQDWSFSFHRKREKSSASVSEASATRTKTQMVMQKGVDFEQQWVLVVKFDGAVVESLKLFLCSKRKRVAKRRKKAKWRKRVGRWGNSEKRGWRGAVGVRSAHLCEFQ